MKTISITDPVVIKSIVESANIDPSGIKMQGDWIAVTGGFKYASIKRLGSKIDGKEDVLLVTEISEGVESLKGMMGTLWMFRGSSYAYLVADKRSVTCIKAYAGTICEIDGGNKLGKCTYKGKTYLGIQFGAAAGRDIYFSGFYSGNCVFSIVLDSEVTWINE